MTKYRIGGCQHIIHHASLWLLSLKGGRLSGTRHSRYRGIRSLNGEACLCKLLWHCTRVLASCLRNNGFLTFCQGHGDSTRPESHGQQAVKVAMNGSAASLENPEIRFQRGPSRPQLAPPYARDEKICSSPTESSKMPAPTALLSQSAPAPSADDEEGRHIFYHAPNS
jgi:hypothetical protein